MGVGTSIIFNTIHSIRNNKSSYSLYCKASYDKHTLKCVLNLTNDIQERIFNVVFLLLHNVETIKLLIYCIIWILQS